jgi:hypothetical protein
MQAESSPDISECSAAESGAISWVLVSGPPRSGTTLLQQILNSHPEIVCLHEFNLLRLHAILDPLFSVEHERQAWMNSFGQNEADLSRSDSVRLSHEEFIGFRFQAVRQVIGDENLIPTREKSSAIYRSVFGAIGGKAGPRVLADKIPNAANRSFVAALQARFGKIKRIYIVRDPVATIASSMRRKREAERGYDNWHIRSVEEAIVEWAVNWQHIALESSEEDVLILRYEDLISDFKSHSHHIASFCGVSDTFSDLIMPVPDALADYQLASAERAEIERQLGALATDWRNLHLNEALRTHETIFATVEPNQKIESNAGGLSSLIFKEGFDDREDWGRWTIAHEARFAFKLRSVREADIWVDIALTSLQFLGGHSQIAVKTNKGPPQLLQIPLSREGIVHTGFICRAHNGLIDCTLFIPHIKGENEEPTADRRGLGVGIVAITPRVL